MDLAKLWSVFVRAYEIIIGSETLLEIESMLPSHGFEVSLVFTCISASAEEVLSLTLSRKHMFAAEIAAFVLAPVVSIFLAMAAGAITRASLIFLVRRSFLCVYLQLLHCLFLLLELA